MSSASSTISLLSSRQVTMFGSTLMMLRTVCATVGCTSISWAWQTASYFFPLRNRSVPMKWYFTCPCFPGYNANSNCYDGYDAMYYFYIIETHTTNNKVFSELPLTC
eukprot:m.41693 g.41693  ORF g.41693 m.41693 type:complete len:107 (-) comp10450_c0_seq1:238-558(-)